MCFVHRHSTVGTQNTIGISPPDSALLFVICSPVGPYYPGGFKPVGLHGTTEYVRAYPGGPFSNTYLSLGLTLSLLGTGAFKIGANYAPAVFPQKQAAKQGYVQNLWLSGAEHNLTEVRTALAVSPFGYFVGIEAVGDRSAR